MSYIFNPDCDAEFPCWQHHAEHHNTQPPTKWVIDLATAALNIRLRSLIFDNTDEAYFKIYLAAHTLHDLINIRWRNCNFAPFPWHVGEGHEYEIKEPINEMGALADLIAALPPTPAMKPFKRRF